MRKSKQHSFMRVNEKVKVEIRSQVSALLFVLPALVLSLTFGVYPFLRTFVISFTDWDGLSSQYAFVGFENYTRAFQDRLWWKSLGNGLTFAVLALLIMNGIALLLALAVNSKIRGRMVYRAIFYLPTIMSGIVVAIIWKWLYQPIGGPINQILENLGLASLKHAWLGDSKTALYAVSVASMWQGIGNPFILFLAGLQGISEELYEAARIDGADSWDCFRHLTIPFLIPVASIISVLTILGAMQLFNIVMAMTNGGPGYATEVPILHIYREAFGMLHFGYATALSIIFGILMFIASYIQLSISRKVGVRAA